MGPTSHILQSTPLIVHVLIVVPPSWMIIKLLYNNLEGYMQAVTGIVTKLVNTDGPS